MRFLFCKLQCPFICFCKPAPHIYTPGPLKLENAPRVPPSTVVSVPDASHQLSSQADEVKDDGIVELEKQRQQQQQQHQQHEVGHCVKSILKKATPETQESRKKQVQWMDFVGKELAEVREFESSETYDNYKDAETSRGCVCIIL